MAGSYNRKDHLYNRAKEEGFRSRAAYKLDELNKKYKLLRSGLKVLDLGCWPGGWIQVILPIIGDSGVVVGIDLVETEAFGVPNALIVQGDLRDQEVIAKALEFAGGKFDLLLSDMSPKLSGIREVDEGATVACAELAIGAAKLALKPTGNIVIKIFKSNDAEQFVKKTKPLFNKIARSELDATRKTSNEYYIVGLGFKG